MNKIVYITDDNYIKPTIVSITSLIETKKNQAEYDISVLINDVSNENILLLNKLIDKLNSKTVNISYQDASSYIKEINEKIVEHRHVSKAALLKFYLSEIFSEWDKILYLDSDIVIQKDISSLFDMDLSNQYAGVIKDLYSVRNRNAMLKCDNNNEWYFNTGVLLLNTKKLREDNICNKFIEHKLQYDTFFMDQDNINAVIGHNVKYLSYKYNCLNYFLKAHSREVVSNFYEDDFSLSDEEIYKNCYILHFGGKPKVWEEKVEYLTDIYNYYHDKSVLNK